MTRYRARQRLGLGGALAPTSCTDNHRHQRTSRNHALIVTRLEEEVAEARARLDRTMRKFPSSDDPAVVRARETLEGLVQRLDRIDRVLVDVVETYPTMVDFSGGPAGADSDGQTRVGASWNNVKHARWFEGQNGMNNQQRPGGAQNDRRSQDQIDLQRESQPSINDPRAPGSNQSAPGNAPDSNSKAGQQGQSQSADARNNGAKSGQDGKQQPRDAQKDDANQGSQSKGEPTGGKQSDSSQRSQSDGKSRDNQGSKSKEERQGGKESDSSERSQSDGKSRDPRAQNGKHDNAKNPGHGSGFVTADLDGDGQPETYYNKGGDVIGAQKNQAQPEDAQKDDAKYGSNSKGQQAGSQKDAEKRGSDQY